MGPPAQESTEGDRSAASVGPMGPACERNTQRSCAIEMETDCAVAMDAHGAGAEHLREDASEDAQLLDASRRASHGVARPVWDALCALAARHILVLFTIAQVVAYSVYFRVPSTLFLYVAFVTVAAPLSLALDVAREWRAGGRLKATWSPCRSVAFATCASATAYLMLCVFLGTVDVDAAAAPGAPLPADGVYFIASNLYNSEAILPKYSRALLELTEELGAENVFVSIYENNSQDNTRALLQALDDTLAQRGVQRRIVSDTLPPSFQKMERIHRLAYLRNLAMAPLYNETAGGLQSRPFSKVIWVNDIVFDARTVLSLLQTHDGAFDQACALDVYSIGFYDTWVTRDLEHRRLRPLWPFFAHPRDQQAVRRARPVLVNSCWNGLTVFDARWFTATSAAAVRISPQSQHPAPVVASLPEPAPAAARRVDVPATLPIKFRTSPTCRASECLLTSLDMHRLAHPKRPLIYMRPDLVVAYDARLYFLYTYLMRLPLVRPWRIVWEDWVSARLFGRISEWGRSASPCLDEFRALWTPAIRST
ncbi:hypothetical protein MSPP1_004150 [Malassezia sp. CBS 17886]|nr:hypothetical protein MSPP1_004150 [Malassezia sp. CBS 17886]